MPPRKKPHPDRVAVICELCNQKFFPASMKHHEPVCARKQGKTKECPSSPDTVTDVL